MASLYSQALLTTSLILFLLLSFPSMTFSQNPSPAPIPTATNCSPWLVPLIPCRPFVEGRAQLPLHSCCDHLWLLNFQRPECFCLFLNDTNLRSSPVKYIHAVRLPALCHIQVNTSACSGALGIVGSPVSQVPIGAQGNSTNCQCQINSTVAASPKPSSIGLGDGRSPGVKFKQEGPLGLLVTLAAIAFTKLMYLV